MPSIDPSIPLGIKTPDITSSLSSMLGVVRGVEGLRGQRIANDANQANLNELNSLRDLPNDPSVQNADGTIDQAKYQQRAQVVAPTLGAGQATASAGADQATTQAANAHFQLQGAQAKAGLETAQGLQGDPRIASGDPLKIAEALNEAQDQMVAKGVPRAQAALLSAPFYAAAGHAPQTVPQLLTNSIRAGLGAQGQLQAQTPTPAFVNTQAGITPVNTNPNAGPVAPMAPSMVPPNQVVSTTNGGVGIANATTGQTGNFNGPASVALPAGETPDTQSRLQAERDAARNVVLQAPTMHDLNANIHRIAASGNITTGVLGQLARDVSSKTGYNFGSTEAQQVNELGKYLARSNQTLSQSMGPHTNAGLEQTNEANGTTSYDPKTIAIIADKNESLLRGTEAYQQGLERAIANSPDQTNPIFAKRAYDQAFGSNFDPRMTQYMLAKDRGDTAAMNEIKKSVGGGQAAIDFQYKMKALDKLTRTGSL